MSRRKKPGGHPARTGRVLAHSVRPARDPALARFAAWYDENAEPGDPVGRDVAAALAELVDATGPAVRRLDLAHPHAAAITPLLDAARGVEPGDGVGFNRVYALHAYLHFVQDAGTWAGTEDELETCLQVIHQLPGPGAPALPLLHALLHDGSDAVPMQVRRDALDRVVVVSAVPDLLGWIGRSRQVTTSGALRLADISRVAALLGVQAAGVRSRRRGEPSLELGSPFDDEPDDWREQPVRVHSMRDVLELDAWWGALLAVNLIELTATTVRPGPRAAEWGSPDPQVALAAREELVEEFVVGVLLYEKVTPTLPVFSAILELDLLHHLALATRPDIQPGVASVRVLTAGAGGDDDGIGRLLHIRTSDLMERLGPLGMVELRPVGSDGVRYVVPRGLRPAVVSVLRRATEDLPAPFGPGSAR